MRLSAALLTHTHSHQTSALRVTTHCSILLCGRVCVRVCWRAREDVRGPPSHSQAPLCGCLSVLLSAGRQPLCCCLLTEGPLVLCVFPGPPRRKAETGAPDLGRAARTPPLHHHLPGVTVDGQNQVETQVLMSSQPQLLNLRVCVCV